MKISFKSNILFEKNKFKSIKLNQKELKSRIQFILSILCDFSTEVSIKFCDKDEMQIANKTFRKKNYATDVLSFPNTLNGGENNFCYLGDILICIPVCLEQAKKVKMSLSEELEKMIVHGILHLKGFDHDRNNAAWQVMTSLETVMRKELIKHLKKPTWCLVVL